MGERIGYVRVSTIDQSLDRQELPGEFKEIFKEKASAKSRARPELEKMMAYVRSGDHVVVWSIDRLARSLRDLQSIIDELLKKGVSIEFVSEHMVFRADDDNPQQVLQMQMMGAFAEFERAISRRRQKEGVAKAKQQHRYKGSEPKYDRDAFRNLFEKGLTAPQVAQVMRCTKMTAYRIMRELGFTTQHEIKTVPATPADNGEEATS